MSGKPDDIPQGVYDRALAIWSIDGELWSDETDLIARAIMAETERCARVADDMASQFRGEREEYSATRIAELIRKS